MTFLVKGPLSAREIGHIHVELLGITEPVLPKVRSDLSTMVSFLLLVVQLLRKKVLSLLLNQKISVGVSRVDCLLNFSAQKVGELIIRGWVVVIYLYVDAVSLPL